MSAGEFTGRVCVVTGASSGVGAAVAAELLARGATVIGLARRFTAGEVKPAAGEICRVRCDVTDADQVDAVIGGLERLDLVVAAAGHGVFGSIAEVTPEALREMLEVHAVGSYRTIRAALAPMARTGGGHVMVIGSTATRWTFDGAAAYSAAKAAQEALARGLAEELRVRSVKMTRVILGAVDTAIWAERPGFDRSRMLTPADAAATIVDAAARPGVAVEELLIRPLAGNL